MGHKCVHDLLAIKDIAIALSSIPAGYLKILVFCAQSLPMRLGADLLTSFIGITIITNFYSFYFY